MPVPRKRPTSEKPKEAIKLHKPEVEVCYECNARAGEVGIRVRPFKKSGRVLRWTCDRCIAGALGLKTHLSYTETRPPQKVNRRLPSGK